MTRSADNIEAVARKLGSLVDDVVFVGGAVIALLITDPAAGGERQTDDVDLIVGTADRPAYYRFCEALRARGFIEDPDGPACRWRIGGIKVDVMPPIAAILGFSNRWYAGALATASRQRIGAVEVSVVSAPLALATKLAAFEGRGGGDFAASHDLEDVLHLIDGRPDLIEEVRSSDPDLREYVADRFTGLLADDAFLRAVPGHLLPDSASQARLSTILERLRALASR